MTRRGTSVIRFEDFPAIALVTASKGECVGRIGGKRFNLPPAVKAETAE